jgi:hypothetical protein
MDVDEKLLAKVPPISDILEEAGVSKAQALKAMRFSEDAACSTFLDTYDSLPLDDRDRVPLEALILKSGVGATEFLGAMLLAIRENSVNRVKLIAMANHPNVMLKTVEFAQQAGGHRDREHLHTMTGALPSSKGINIFNRVINTPGQGQPQEPVQEAEVVTSDLNYMFPDSSNTQQRLTAVRQKQLESGK